MKLDFVYFCGAATYLLEHYPWCQATARGSPQPMGSLVFPSAPCSAAPGRQPCAVMVGGLVGEEAGPCSLSGG